MRDELKQDAKKLNKLEARQDRIEECCRIVERLKKLVEKNLPSDHHICPKDIQKILEGKE